MNLGITISQLRKKKGIKQSDVANQCNITQSYLSRVENNKHLPNLQTLKTISEILGTPLAVLLLMSLEESDVQDDKKADFKIIHPILQSLIEKIA